MLCLRDNYAAKIFQVLLLPVPRSELCELSETTSWVTSGLILRLSGAAEGMEGWGAAAGWEKSAWQSFTLDKRHSQLLSSRQHIQLSWLLSSKGAMEPLALFQVGGPSHFYFHGLSNVFVIANQLTCCVGWIIAQKCAVLIPRTVTGLGYMAMGNSGY